MHWLSLFLFRLVVDPHKSHWLAFLGDVSMRGTIFHIGMRTLAHDIILRSRPWICFCSHSHLDNHQRFGSRSVCMLGRLGTIGGRRVRRLLSLSLTEAPLTVLDWPLIVPSSPWLRYCVAWTRFNARYARNHMGQKEKGRVNGPIEDGKRGI